MQPTDLRHYQLLALKTKQLKTSCCKDDNGYFSPTKTATIKKYILISSTSPRSQCSYEL